MDIFIKILQNNLDGKEIKFHVFDTFSKLNARKIRKFENKFANYVHQYFFFATQHFCYYGITLHE